MITIPSTLQPVFIAAGWRAADPSSRPVEDAKSATDRCRVIIGEFGGLRVGQSGPGIEVAASDVHFYSGPRPEVGEVTLPWRRQVGSTAAFATAHNDHMVLLVNDAGEFFVFTDPDEKLYNVGKSFGDLLQRLIWGYALGVPRRRDA